MFVKEDSIAGKDDAMVSVAVSMYRNRKKTLKERYQYALVCLGLLTAFFLLVIGSVYTSPDTETVTKPNGLSTACVMLIIVGVLGYYLGRMAKRDYDYWQEDRFAWCESIAEEHLRYVFKDRFVTRGELISKGELAHDFRMMADVDKETKHKLYKRIVKIFFCGWAIISVLLISIQVLTDKSSFGTDFVLMAMLVSLCYMLVLLVFTSLVQYMRVRDYRSSDYDEAVNLYLESQNQ